MMGNHSRRVAFSQGKPVKAARDEGLLRCTLAHVRNFATQQLFLMTSGFLSVLLCRNWLPGKPDTTKRAANDLRDSGSL
jgi:hypothetical protein